MTFLYQVKKSALFGLLGIALCQITTGVHASPEYTITDLGVLSGDVRSEANAINDNGQVAGTSIIAEQTTSDPIKTRAFLYSAGTLTDVRAAGGRSNSVASSINVNGQVVGSDIATDGSRQGFLYKSGTVTRPGGLPGAKYSEADGINASGQICGFSDTTSGQQHAFLYSSGTMTDLGVIAGGAFSSAYAINDTKMVTGVSSLSDGSNHAFLTTNGTMQDLGTLGGPFSWGMAINSSGQVVGYAATADNAQHAFLYSNSTMTDLGTVSGDDYSSAQGINTAGQIVGYSGIGDTSKRAFLYRNGTLTDLNTLIDGSLGWQLKEARAINTAGQIIGYGLHNGVSHAFLMTPSTLTAPMNVTAKAISSSQIDLSWTRVLGASSYNVFRSTSAGTYHSYVGSTATTTYSNTGLSPLTSYYYIVVAANSGGSGPKSTEVSATTPSGVPGALSNLKAVGTSRSQINLTWSAAAAATAYSVFQSSSAGTYHSYIGQTTGTNFTSSGLSAGTPYYYIVVPTNSIGNGPKSAEVTGTTTTLPDAPTNVKAAAVSNVQINLSWTAAAGATSYNVFRGTVQSGLHSYVATTTSPSYNDTQRTPSTSYYYIIVGVNATGSGAKSAEASATTPATSLPSAPTNVKATAVSKSQINLTWTAATGATSYNVFRGTAPGAMHSYVATTTTPSYNDAQRTPSTSYYYIIVGVNDNGSGAKSAEASATTPAN